jgi:Family of unknown function (DUF6504)
MRVIRGEPVEVWLRHGRPARFVWRGRLHTVMFVLDRRLVVAAQADIDVTSQERAELSADSRECWLVEATPERTLPPSTYELCHDLAADRWLLSRS